MDYPNTCEGYEPARVPFHPIQQQTVHHVQAPRPATPNRPAPKVQAKAQAKMPKAQVLALVQRLKKGVIIGSIVCFGATIGLIVNQTNSVTASQTTAAAATSSQSSSQASAQNTNSTQTNQDTSQVGTTQQGGGYATFSLCWASSSPLSTYSPSGSTHLQTLAGRQSSSPSPPPITPGGWR